MVNPIMKSCLKKEFTYTVSGSLWIECDNKRFFGPGRVQLLEGIEKTGSINQAAKLMGMSYKKAWEMVNDLNTRLDKPFVVTQAGGEKGGGSVVTAEAKELVKYHKQLRKRFLNFLTKETGKLEVF